MSVDILAQGHGQSSLVFNVAVLSENRPGDHNKGSTLLGSARTALESHSLYTFKQYQITIAIDGHNKSYANYIQQLLGLLSGRGRPRAGYFLVVFTLFLSVLRAQRERDRGQQIFKQIENTDFLFCRGGDG